MIKEKAPPSSSKTARKKIIIQCTYIILLVIIMSDLQVVTAPKDYTYQLRMNSEIKAELERIYAECGVTLSDAINIFLQQSLNEHGFPFAVVSDQTAFKKKKVLDELLEIHMRGMRSGSEYGWTDDRDMDEEFGGSE
ncbi:MAG: phosphatase [Thermoplasmata archaeon]|nr:phosphatase [Thermoplasmata archaeon]